MAPPAALGAGPARGLTGEQMDGAAVTLGGSGPGVQAFNADRDLWSRRECLPGLSLR